jgi:hypothetical protein
LTAVILGPRLPAAHQKWTPDNDLYDTPALIEELVTEGRPELRPSLG